MARPGHTHRQPPWGLLIYAFSEAQRLPALGPSLGQKGQLGMSYKKMGLWVKDEGRFDFLGENS